MHRHSETTDGQNGIFFFNRKSNFIGCENIDLNLYKVNERLEKGIKVKNYPKWKIVILCADKDLIKLYVKKNKRFRYKDNNEKQQEATEAMKIPWKSKNN